MNLRTRHFITLLILLGSLFTLQIAAAKERGSRVVRVADYGLHPGSGKDATPIVRRILDEHKSSHALLIRFEQGRYDFYPDKKQQAAGKPTTCFDLFKMRNVEIDGGGCDWIFHGLMKPVKVANCENTTLRNLHIDWERPYNSQAEIVAATDTYLDIKIDSTHYPYRIAGDSLVFVGEYGLQRIIPEYTNLYDGRTHELLYQTRDTPLGRELFQAPVTSLGNGLVRFHYHPAIKPVSGSIVVFFHGRYITNGIEITDSRNTHIEDVTLYHTLSCGVSCNRSRNIALKNLNIVVNESKGRVFSTIADATHFINCTGEILFDGCTVSGSGDDVMNIHGMYAPVSAVSDKHTVRITPTGRDQGFREGEQVWVLDTVTMQRSRPLTAVRTEPIQGSRDYKLTFKEPITGRITAGNILENATCCPRLTVRNCRMLKQNRGRSILVTTPAKVLIEHNYFRSAGAAILIEGDTDLWYESGAVCNVTIRNNLFEDCYTSGNNLIDAPWGWGEGVITISPSIRPQNADTKAYHHNIHIEENTFRHFDYAVLFARSVEGLNFSRNRLERTYTYKPFYRPCNLFLDGCRKVLVNSNSFGKDFLGHNIYTENMRISEISQRGRQPLEIISKQHKADE